MCSFPPDLEFKCSSPDLKKTFLFSPDQECKCPFTIEVQMPFLQIWSANACKCCSRQIWSANAFKCLFSPDLEKKYLKCIYFFSSDLECKCLGKRDKEWSGEPAQEHQQYEVSIILSSLYSMSMSSSHTHTHTISMYI